MYYIDNRLFLKELYNNTVVGRSGGFRLLIIVATVRDTSIYNE